MSVKEHDIEVNLEHEVYHVYVGSNILGKTAQRIKAACPKTGSFVVVSDTQVAPLYLETLTDSLQAAGFKTHSFVFEAGESSKNFPTFQRLLEYCAEAGLTRDDAICALGGGVVGDMGGFAAATYMRGIAFVQIPTSLLAMVDASVGGKTAIDLAAGKNLIGAFWQPKLVIADTDTLSTLAPELFIDSVGEVIKHAILADALMFLNLESKALIPGAYSDQELVDIIAKNIEIKRSVVVQDEREANVRQTLNLGHTLGHAIEQASTYRLGHGSSVSIGTCAVSRWAAKKQLLDGVDARRICGLFKAHGLPTTTDFSTEDLLPYILRDKKRHANGINLVVPRAIGAAQIMTIDTNELEELIACARETEYV